MLTEQDLIAYLESELSPEERASVEAELVRDPQVRRQLLHQVQLDAALRAALGSEAANRRVKQSVLALLRGEQEEALKQRVLADATRLSGSKPFQVSQTSPISRFGVWMAEAIRFLAPTPRGRLAIAGVACLCLLATLWFALRPGAGDPGLLASTIEVPTRVDFPVDTEIHPRPGTKIQHDRRAGSFTPRPGDGLRVGTIGSATVRFADGTVLHLEPGAELVFQPVSPLRSGGKQLRLISGSLSAEVARQAEGLPLLIQTPHALVTVVGTEFDLSVATNQTALEVTRGLVKMAGSDNTNVVSVAAGEFAVASPRTAMRYGRLARSPFLWPFSSASIWNRPLGSGARFAPFPGQPFLVDGPLQDAVRPRRPFLGSASDPLRRVWVNGGTRADIRLSDSRLPPGQMRDSIVLLQRARRFALELADASVRPDGDLEATDLERIPLNGPGVFPASTPAVRFGLPQLGGLLRIGELESGIRHALSARVSRDRLGGNVFSNPTTVWPAAGNPASTVDGHLCVGSLLAIPPDVDVAKLFGSSGPNFELARALQDYGVYVTGVGDAPFVLLADSARIPDADAWLTRLVPLLQVVINNTPQTPGGGGTPRRETAPPLPGESE